MKRGENKTTEPPQPWADAIQESRADFAAGRIVDSERVHQKIRESIARMEAVQATAD